MDGTLLPYTREVMADVRKGWFPFSPSQRREFLSDAQEQGLDFQTMPLVTEIG